MIKVKDVAFGRITAPDLDAEEAFLTEFGMRRAARTKTALYMRGTESAHHIHVTELGEPRFIGIAFHAQSEEDLERLARLDGASAVEEIDEPGGGRRVRLREPNGYQVEIVHGIATLDPIAVERPAVNWRSDKLSRAGTLSRLPRGPAHVRRIGHAVMGAPDVKNTVAWFRETLGLICSDDVYAGDKDNIIGSFNRCDLGEAYVDHHVFFCAHNERAGLNHLSYEVEDIDDVVIGHEHLKQLGKYEHIWGIGRHMLGSQVFDYWADPWGRIHEHWTDSDRLNATSGSNLLPAELGLTSQWGPPIPDAMIGHVSQ